MVEVNKGDMIVVWVSCGVVSVVVVIIVVCDYSEICNVRLINNFIKEEYLDN